MIVCLSSHTTRCCRCYCSAWINRSVGKAKMNGMYETKWIKMNIHEHWSCNSFITRSPTESILCPKRFLRFNSTNPMETIIIILKCTAHHHEPTIWRNWICTSFIVHNIDRSVHECHRQLCFYSIGTCNHAELCHIFAFSPLQILKIWLKNWRWKLRIIYYDNYDHHPRVAATIATTEIIFRQWIDKFIRCTWIILTTATFVAKIGKSPNVAQTNRVAHTRQYKLHFTRPLLSFRFQMGRFRIIIGITIVIGGAFRRAAIGKWRKKSILLI